MPNTKKRRTAEELAFNAVVGRNIKYLRKYKKLNQTQVATGVKVKFQQLQKYEKGFNACSSYRLDLLAKFFKVSTDVLADPEMITKHRGFTGDKDWIVANNLTPQILVGSLDEIKDKLIKDGINPEETVLPTLRNAAKKELN